MYALNMKGYLLARVLWIILMTYFVLLAKCSNAIMFHTNLLSIVLNIVNMWPTLLWMIINTTLPAIVCVLIVKTS